MNPDFLKRAKALSGEVSRFGKKPLPKKEAPKKKTLSSEVARISQGRKAPEPRPLSTYMPSKETQYVFDTPEAIANKLNTLPGALNPEVVREIPTVEGLIKALKELKGNDRIDISNIRNGEQLSRISQRIDMNDMRWHGGGGGGSGTVTSVSSADANITVATGTTTPVLTLVQAPALKSATTTVSVAAATAPSAGQVLTATNDHTATWQTPSVGSGTVTDVSVVSANGFAGTVANSTTTPAITLTTTITGLLKGNGTAISAASASTDYAALAFKTIAVSGQSDVVADSPIDTLTLVGSGITITTNASTDTITFTGAAAALTVGTTVISSGTTTRILYDNGGVLGEYTLTGSGTVVAMQTAPTFATSITTPSVLATANDSGALGASGTAFADLFLASGGVINWAAGNVTLTHSTGILTQNAGELRITSANVGTNADSVPTLSSTSTLTNKTLTSPTIQTTPTYASGTNLILTVPTVDDTATGEITNAFNSGYSSSAIGDLVYLDSSATWQKADADASATTYGSGPLGIALEVKAASNALKVLLRGFAYCSTAFPTFTIGGAIYMSASPGVVTQTAPVATDSATRVLGYAVHADKMWFNPSNDYITHA